MAATTSLITVAEFERIPNPVGGKYELRKGELAVVPFPRKLHQRLRTAIVASLTRLLGSQGFIAAEFAFRPTDEYNEGAVDAGFLIQRRWDALGDADCLIGVPDLCVEVLSPSNTASDMNEREAVCLANGCRQFWIIDPNLNIVKVSKADRHTRTYTMSDEIDLAEFGGGKLRVAEIWG